MRRSRNPTTVTVTLGENPTPGNLVCIGVITAGGTIANLSIQDANGNDYSNSSPVTTDNFQVWVASLIAPANADKIITANWTGPANVDFLAEEFGGGPFIPAKEAAARGIRITVPLPDDPRALRFRAGSETELSESWSVITDYRDDDEADYADLLKAALAYCQLAQAASGYTVLVDTE
jgi:hypothetical protein